MLLAGYKPRKRRKVNEVKCERCGASVPRRVVCSCGRRLCKSCKEAEHGHP